ncbi:MAG: hypothetical protein LOD91_07310, partial [Limnochordales bacterium]
WKFQHPEGPREINELHVPAGRPVKITVTSEDVIHSLFFPSFRTKIDAIPGRYMDLWFEATTPGTYHIFCAEYCGTNHSGMIGSVIVMEETAYQSWWSAPATRALCTGLAGRGTAGPCWGKPLTCGRRCGRCVWAMWTATAGRSWSC